MLTPMLHWVRGIEPHRIALTPRPEGFDALPARIEVWRQAGIGCVVSLLESNEVNALGLAAEERLCMRTEIRFRSFGIPDHGIPDSPSAFRLLLEDLRCEVERGTAIAIHCHAGIGRTGILAACLLDALSVPKHQIFDTLRESRGFGMPETTAQRLWVEEFMRSRAAGT